MAVSSANEVLPIPAQCSPERTSTKFRRHIALECDAMVRYALGNGLKLPPSLQQSLELFENVVEEGDLSVPVAYLATLHGQLADVVAPATPRTIYLLHIDRSRNSWASILGPLSSIRRLVLGAAFFTMVFVLSSLSDSISHKNLTMDIYSLDGMESLQILVFLMSAAAMGGCFHALFIAHSYIEQGTYDPRFESSYWMRIGLGIIAGLVLSQMIPIGAGPEAGDATAPVSSASVFGKPLLSLLGGFSATLVYTILQRLVETVESLFTQRQGLAAGNAGNRAASETLVLSAAPDAGVPAPSPVMPAPTAADDAKPAVTAGSISAAAASAAALAAATTAIATATAATLDSGTQTAPATPPADEAATPIAPEPSEAAPAGEVDAPATADPTTLKSA